MYSAKFVKFPWCSGYHVCLTRRRSPVRSWAETNLLWKLSVTPLTDLIIILIFMKGPCKLIFKQGLTFLGETSVICNTIFPAILPFGLSYARFYSSALPHKNLELINKILTSGKQHHECFIQNQIQRVKNKNKRVFKNNQTI